jgi:hypothetical protein
MLKDRMESREQRWGRRLWVQVETPDLKLEMDIWISEYGATEVLRGVGERTLRMSGWTGKPGA